MTQKEELKRWIDCPNMDNELLDELIKIKDDESKIKDNFAGLLQFGTAGLRGVIGAGTNRMNRFVVGLATQGLSEVIKEAKGEERGVVIAYDSRKNSRLFAEEAAKVLAGNNIKTYLFSDLRPVPELSYAIRELKAIAGIVVTASHNPYIYNGYKAYWEDGSQLPPKEAEKVYNVMTKLDIFSDVKRAEIDNPLINIIDKEIDDKYTKEVLKLQINPDVPKKAGDSFKVIYTPFHGTGNIPVRRVLKEAGYKNVIVVKEQELPDPMFSTVKSPNPEDKEGFYIAMDYADKYDADLLLGTDPDCDRVGIVVKNSEGEYVSMTGNQVGVLLCDYILRARKERGTLPENGAVIKSIVSTKMVKAVCDSYNVKLIDVLTGFKFIGEQIKNFEKTSSNTFLFGFEESYGYLSGTHARDKDGVNASLLITEMAAYYKLKGMTLYEAMNSLYEKYGYYKEETSSAQFAGLEGMAKIKEIMKNLREDPLKTLGKTEVIKLVDYKEGIDDLPKADVLRMELKDDTTVFIRPSGTEPKVKAYVMVKGKTDKDGEDKKAYYKEAIFKEIFKM